jgi:hypothetical protein
LNNNGAFISSLIGSLNPQVIADAINNNQSFLTQTMTYMNTSDVIDVLNNNVSAQTTVNALVGLLRGDVIAGAMNQHPELTQALFDPGTAPGGQHYGIDPDILMPLLATPQVKNFLGPFMANMSPTGTRTLLTSSGNFIGNLLNRASGGLNPNVLVEAIAGPKNSGVINPRTGTGFSPSQNILRRTWMYGCTQIVFGWTLPAMEGWVQMADARLNASPGTPVGPW